MDKWTLGVNIVDSRSEDNYKVNNWMILEGLTLTRATNLMSDIQRYTRLEEHEELIFMITKEEEKENKTETYEEIHKEL